MPKHKEGRKAANQPSPRKGQGLQLGSYELWIRQRVNEYLEKEKRGRKRT